MESDTKIIDILQELLLRYGFPECSIEAAAQERLSQGSGSAKTFIVRVSEEDSRFLIGQFGNNLQSLQHIARMIIAKHLPEFAGVPIYVDVNEYRKKKNQSLADLAREAAREAEKSGQTVVLRPMSAYDRRLVHMELAKEKGVTTESVGEGADRRIAVKPLHATGE